MKTIKKPVENTIVIKNSKFITFLYEIKSEDEVIPIINMIKAKFKDASHYCYSYIVDNNERAFDDKEPSSTAGLPILSVLKKQQLNHILCVVVRYFGGIKLGAGGLVRAYTKSCSEALKKAELSKLVEGFLVVASFPYEKQKQIDALLNDVIIKEKIYKTNVTYYFLIPKEDIDRFKPLFLTFEILNSEYIKRNV